MRIISRFGENNSSVIIPFQRGYFKLITACSNCFNAHSNVARGQAIFNRMKPSPSLPNVAPSFNAK